MKWKTVRLDDICTRITSGGTPKSTEPELYFPKEIPWLKTGEVNYQRIYDTETYISKEGLSRSSAKLIPVNSIIIAMYGQGDTAGRVAINKIPLSTNQACCNLIINHDLANYEFVYYVLSTMYDQFVALKNGGAQPNLNAGMIKAIEIPFPDIATQTKIADILSAYDGFSYNVINQIKILTEATKRIYREWFTSNHKKIAISEETPLFCENITVLDCLDFYIGGGWGKEFSIGKNTVKGKVIRGTDIEDILVGKFDGVPLRFHTENEQASRTLKANDIVFELSNGNIKNIGRNLLVDDLILKNTGENTICASFCKLLRPKDKLHSLILYLEIQDMQDGGRLMKYKKQGSNGINNFAFDDFLKHEFMIPKDEKMIELLDNMVSKISILRNELFLLNQARDRLLTKLISGELETK